MKKNLGGYDTMKSTASRFLIGVALIIAIGAVAPVSADYTAGMDAFKAKA